MLSKIIAIALPAPLAVTGAMVARGPGASITWQISYKPLVDANALGEKLFNGTRLSTNGVSSARFHVKHGAFQARFTEPLFWDFKELAALTENTALLQKTFKLTH